MDSELTMNYWDIFCGQADCQNEDTWICSSWIMEIIDPFSCINHILIISAHILLSFLLLLSFLSRRRTTLSASKSISISLLSICSLIFNISLAFAYFALGVWTAKETKGNHACLVMVVQGLIWLFLSLSVSKKIPHFSFICYFAALLAAFQCSLSTWAIIVSRSVSTKEVLDILSFPGAILLLSRAIQASNQETHGDVYFESVEDKERVKTTPFAEAGFCSRMSFSWLNPLMKEGKLKTLENEDIPGLRLEDKAETCYSIFQGKSSDKSSIMSAILDCQKKTFFVSGFFALLKIVTVSSGPIFLYAFIDLAQGREAFRYEGYVLTGGLFLAKCIESVAERQWFFRTRLIGLQLQSLITAAIYKKQLRLSHVSKTTHSSGEIMNYVTVDAYKVGEFPYWFHQIWTTALQICIALMIMFYVVGVATIPALVVIVLSMLGNFPVAKIQSEYLTELMVAQDRMVKAVTEAVINMKVLKLYAWETHFRNTVGLLRKEETKWLSKVQIQKGYYLVLFWSSPIIVSAVTFWACYLLDVPLNASSVFTFLATLRIVQEPIRSIPDVLGVFIEAKVSFFRIVKFLEADEIKNSLITRNSQGVNCINFSLLLNCKKISWDVDSSASDLENVHIVIKPGEKVAICGEVGSGKSTLLAAILGEVPCIDGSVEIQGSIAYVSQNAWIQTGTIQQNILFGSTMDQNKYQEVINRCSLVKDLEILPFHDQTVIGERGVNLSGGQKQRVQLARALYQDAEIYLLDDPFSAVDAHTARSLFNDYVMEALSGKTVLLVTHQVDFLPTFDSILLMSKGKILEAATYDKLLVSSQEFRDLVQSHGVIFKREINTKGRHKTTEDSIQKLQSEEQLIALNGEQLIKQEEREVGHTGFKPYGQYLGKNKGYFYFSLAIVSQLIYIIGNLVQNLWLARNLQSFTISQLKLISIYSLIGGGMAISLFSRSYAIIVLGLEASKSFFSEFITSLFRAPMSFYESTPTGRILSRVSSDLSILDLELPFKFSIVLASSMTAYFSLGILATLTWSILFVIIPMVFVTILLQRFYFASAKELKRIHGTTKSSVASHLSEFNAGAITIRAFGKEDRFFSESLQLIDKNASSFFHSFAANEWLILRLEIMCASILSSSALALTLLPHGDSKTGYIGMALSYALSLNVFLVSSVHTLCLLENSIVSVERLEQYMHIPSEAPEVIECNRPPLSWPQFGQVEILDLKVRYRPNTPLVLQGISCKFGGYKVGIVGRTGSGKTTLISTLFRLVEPAEGSITIDGLNISRIGIHDLRSHLAIIPQEPTLFRGSIRYNLDPLSEHNDHEIWEVLKKCKLGKVVEKKQEGLNSLVTEDGSNWSMGQRQLFCLGRAILKRRKILVLDEATASIDNATDSIIQKTIRSEFAECTVITVAHRIPTVMDCTMVLSLRDGKLVEYDSPMKLINEKDSLFGQLVKEYWLRSGNAVM